jgi:hypothetical protein
LAQVWIGKAAVLATAGALQNDSVLPNPGEEI